MFSSRVLEFGPAIRIKFYILQTYQYFINNPPVMQTNPFLGQLFKCTLNMQRQTTFNETKNHFVFFFYYTQKVLVKKKVVCYVKRLLITHFVIIWHNISKNNWLIWKCIEYFSPSSIFSSPLNTRHAQITMINFNNWY